MIKALAFSIAMTSTPVQHFSEIQIASSNNFDSQSIDLAVVKKRKKPRKNFHSINPNSQFYGV